MCCDGTNARKCSLMLPSRTGSIKVYLLLCTNFSTVVYRSHINQWHARGQHTLADLDKVQQDDHLDDQEDA